MSFLSFSALWFALSIPVVLAFYLLKRRRKAHLVSSTLLWERYLTETQANAPFQKLRRNLLLLLQILILIFAVLALARPYFSNQLSGGALQVLVIDVSASMQSVDVSPSRFSKAKEKAKELINGLRDSDQMIIVTAGANTELVQSPTSEKTLLRRAIESIEVSDAPTQLFDALKLAEARVRDHPSSEIHLISDGAISDLSDWNEADLKVHFHKIGERGNNLGIVSMDLRSNPENPNQRALFSNVINFSTNDFQTIAELHFEDRLIESRSLSIEKGGAASLAFIVPQQTNGIFRLNILAKDDLAIDNSASLVSLLPKPAKVLMYSQGNRFLEKALRSLGEIELSTTEDHTLDSDHYDVVVLDNFTPINFPKSNVMAINIVRSNWFSGGKIVASPAVVDWRNDHPLLRFVSFDEVEIAEAFEVNLPFWGETLVESNRSPIIISGEQGGQKRLWIGFDTLSSTWPLRVSFPMFMANAIDWLNPSSSRGKALNVKVGQPIEVEVETQSETLSITPPSGKKESVIIRKGLGKMVYGNTSKTGIYQVDHPEISETSDDSESHESYESHDSQFAFSVNLLDAAESDTTPRTSLSVSGGRQVEANVTARADLEIWRWIAFAAFAILLFEWWYFHKRTA